MKKIFTKTRDLLHDPKFTTAFHKWLTIIWILLIIPGILWWAESIPFLVFMSLWANIAGHWSAYQASRAELKQDENNNSD